MRQWTIVLSWTSLGRFPFGPERLRHRGNPHIVGPADVEAVLAALAQWLSGPEHMGLRRAFGEWIRQVRAPVRRLGTEWPTLDDWSEDRPMLYETR